HGAAPPGEKAFVTAHAEIECASALIAFNRMWTRRQSPKPDFASEQIIGAMPTEAFPDLSASSRTGSRSSGSVRRSPPPARGPGSRPAGAVVATRIIFVI